MEKQRNPYFDILKAISIILVIVGHCIQYGAGMDYLRSGIFLYNPLFIFIYSFHMPLFMIISGYLFGYSCKNKSEKQLLFSKIKQLLIPLFCWSFINLFIQIIKVWAGISTNPITFIWMCQTVFSGFIHGPWFLWAIWWSSLVVIIGRRFFKDNVLFYLLICLLTLIIPDKNNTAVYKFMLPFFLAAYLFNSYDYKTKFKKLCNSKLLAILFGVLFVILLRYYNFDSYIYTSGHCVLGKNIWWQLNNNLFRFFIGTFGSISVMYLVYFLTNQRQNAVINFFGNIGQKTLGIYLISNYIFDELLKRLPILGLNYWYILIETISILLVSILITTILKRFKTTNRLLLGGR